MPLPTDELSYDETWIYLMKQLHPEIDLIDKCIRARSITTLMHGGPGGKAKNLFEWYNPDYVIIHLGLSDCAPRLLPRKSKITKIINHLPISNQIYSYFRRHGGRRIEYADVSPIEFKNNLEGYVKKVAPIPVGIVQISKVTSSALVKSPLFNEAIDIYNTIISEIVSENNNAKLISGLDGTDSDMYQSDGMHLTKKGQEVIFEECNKFIEMCNNKK